MSSGKQGGKQFTAVLFWIGATLAVMCLLSTCGMLLLEAIYEWKR